MFSKKYFLLLLAVAWQPAYPQPFNHAEPKIRPPVFRHTVRDRQVKDVVFQKRDTSCGGATLAMLLQNSMGIATTEDAVLAFVEKTRGQEFDSVNFNDMMGFAEQQGVDGLAQFRSFDEMKTLVHRGIPFIVRVRAANADKVDSDLAKYLYHFVVVRGIANGLVSISDPSLQIGNMQYTQKEFLSMIDIDENGKGKVFFLLPKEGSAREVNEAYIAKPNYYPFQNSMPRFIR